nr:protein SENESCENCE-ASSOCIATED GENE 21, mitochondrial-like [Ipomoea batatas]
MTTDGPKAMVIQKVLKTALRSIKISNAGSIEKKGKTNYPDPIIDVGQRYPYSANKWAFMAQLKEVALLILLFLFFLVLLTLIQVSNAKTSRSYTAATMTQGSVFGEVGRSNTMFKKGGDESGKSTTTSWIPDPVTGIY